MIRKLIREALDETKRRKLNALILKKIFELEHIHSGTVCDSTSPYETEVEITNVSFKLGAIHIFDTEGNISISVSVHHYQAYMNHDERYTYPWPIAQLIWEHLKVIFHLNFKQIVLWIDYDGRNRRWLIDEDGIY